MKNQFYKDYIPKTNKNITISANLTVSHQLLLISVPTYCRYHMQFLNIYFVSIYHLPFDIVKCFPPKLCFSFSLGENLISQKLNQKENNYPIITKYTLQFRLPRLWIHSSGRLVGKNNVCFLGFTYSTEVLLNNTWAY